jgi:hypothetical protein
MAKPEEVPRFVHENRQKRIRSDASAFTRSARIRDQAKVGLVELHIRAENLTVTWVSGIL